jgi:hypothetical protein
MNPTQIRDEARRDANKYKKTSKDKPISWRDAIAYQSDRVARSYSNQWSEGEQAIYLEAFAKRLVERGFVRPKGAKVSGPSGRSKLPKREFRAPAEDFAAQEGAAERAGLSWNQWMLAAAREKLARSR